MKVLVTGATSGLGRNAVEFLCQKGISVRATGRNEAMGKLLEKMGAEFVPADLTELVSSQAKVMLAGIDTLWHCSSFTSPWGTILVGDGIAEVTPAYVMVLVDSAERPEDIDKNRAEAARIRAEERLQHQKSMHEYYQSQIALQRAMQRLQAASKYKR